MVFTVSVLNENSPPAVLNFDERGKRAEDKWM